MEAAAKTFFQSPRFAVAGASPDTSKFGYRGRHNPRSTDIVTHTDIKSQFSLGIMFMDFR